MLDASFRPVIDVILRWPARILSRYGIGANSITIIGGIMGISAFVLICFGFYQSALAFIVLNRLADGMDGAVARAMGAQGAQGAMLDSMADLVSSGLAPAFVGMALMMEWQATGVMPDGVASFTVLPLTVLMAAAWRLARFSRQAVQGPESEESNGDERFDFEGLPAPFAALFWAGLVWTWAQCPGVGCDGLWILGMLGCTLLPLGMVSSLPQVGLKHWGQDKRWDAMRGVWLLAVGSVSIGLGPLGGVLALISYPLFGAIAHRFGTSK